MRVAWIFRSKKRNEHSIENIFDSIQSYVEGYEIEKYYLPEPRWNTFSSWKSNLSYSREVKADIHHITGEVYYISSFISKRKLMITLEDLVLIDRNKGLRKLYYYVLYYGLAFFRADSIVCISKAVKAELVKKYPFCKKKAHYVPCPVNENFQYFEKEFNEDEPVILVVGTSYNKNVERVIAAVDGIRCKLVLVGKLNDDHKRLLLKHKVNYSNVVNIPLEDLCKLYTDCDILCFPSLFEGFGLPIVEGQSVGRAVLTSNFDPMLEVSGGDDCACLVDPYDTESIRTGLLRIINDKDYREKLIENGLKNALRYQPKRVARMYTKLYERL